MATRILINRLSDAVSSKLTRGATVPAASVAIPAAAGTERFDLAASAAEFAQWSWHVVRSYPDLAASSIRIWELLDTSQRGRLLFLFLLALSGTLALGAERLIRWALDGSRRRLISIEPAPGSSIALLAAVDLIPLLGLAAVGFGCVALWFRTSEPQSSLGADLIEALLTWRFYAYVFDIWFRPRCAAARIVPLDTTELRQLYHGVLWVSGILVLTDTWIEISPRTAPLGTP